MTAEEDDEVEEPGAVSLAAWWRAARSRFFSFSEGPLMAWSVRRRSREGGRRGREGVWGTWVAKGAVQLDICKASTGGEVQGGFTTLSPD